MNSGTAPEPQLYLFFVIGVVILLAVVLGVLRARGRRKDALPTPTGEDGTGEPGPSEGSDTEPRARGVAARRRRR